MNSLHFHAFGKPRHIAFTEARIGLDTVTLFVAAERASLSLLSAIESASPAPLELPALAA